MTIFLRKQVSHGGWLEHHAGRLPRDGGGGLLPKVGWSKATNRPEFAEKTSGHNGKPEAPLRHPRIERPAHNDPFCNRGKAWMKRVELPSPDRQLFDEDLEMHELLDRHIRTLEDGIETDNAAHADALRLRTLPGVGKVRRKGGRKG